MSAEIFNLIIEQCSLNSKICDLLLTQNRLRIVIKCRKFRIKVLKIRLKLLLDLAEKRMRKAKIRRSIWKIVGFF